MSTEYDLSILNKFVLVGPLVMFGAQVASHKLAAAETNATWVRWFSQIKKYITKGFARIAVFSLMPPNRVSLFNMLRVILKKFKIFYSIVCSFAVNMMDSFFLFKFSTNMLLHNIYMFQHSFTVYVDTHVTQLGQCRFIVFITVRRFRNVITSISKPSATVHLTNLTRRFSQYVLTIFYPTGVTFSHTTIITQGIN